MHDVVVLGAGPAGNIAALRLSEMGHDVAVLDWRHNLGDKLCTGIIGRECFERFRPDSEHVLHEARSVCVFAPSGASYTVQREQPEAYVIDRVAFVASLAHRAAVAGATFALGEKVVDIRNTEEGLEVDTVGRDGGRSHSAKALIVATGFGTPLLNMVGLSAGASLRYMVGSQAKVATSGLGETEVYLGSVIALGSFGWLVPMSASTALAGIVSQAPSNGHISKFLSFLGDSGKIDSVIDQPRRWGIPIEPLAKTFGERVLVAGDAAGLAKPTTGGGIYYSLLSGEIAAEVMGDAITAADLSAGRLEEYETRWKTVFGKELDVGYFARRLFESLDDGQIDHLLEALASTDVHRDLFSSRAFAFDWHSRVILKALGHRGLASFLRSIGPLLTPFLSRLARRAE